MKALRAPAPGRALEEVEAPVPQAGPGQVLVKVSACGVCRTDLHVVDGELSSCRYPVVPGHEIVGTVAQAGDRFREGERVGIPWLAWTCGQCSYCASGRENLCERARFTGCHVDGGYAEYAAADERFCLRIPPRYSDLEAAPLLCAGLIGYRSYTFAGDARTLGLYGFGAAAHVLAQVASAEGRRVFAFTRPGDAAAILFAPAGALVPEALARVRKGGRVICGGIHMSDIPSFPYALLWGERQVVSVANLTRADGERFMTVAGRVPIRTEVHPYPLARANDALADLRAGRFSGAAVLTCVNPVRPHSGSLDA